MIGCKTVVGQWKSQPICRKCKANLSESQLYHCNGVCPHCGNTSKYTMVDYEKRIYRNIISTFFIFPYKIIREYKE